MRKGSPGRAEHRGGAGHVAGMAAGTSGWGDDQPYLGAGGSAGGTSSLAGPGGGSDQRGSPAFGRRAAAPETWRGLPCPSDGAVPKAFGSSQTFPAYPGGFDSRRPGVGDPSGPQAGRWPGCRR